MTFDFAACGLYLTRTIFLVFSSPTIFQIDQGCDIWDPRNEITLAIQLIQTLLLLKVDTEEVQKER